MASCGRVFRARVRSVFGFERPQILATVSYALSRAVPAIFFESASLPDSFSYFFLGSGAGSTARSRKISKTLPRLCTSSAQNDAPVDLSALRVRLARMSDTQLLHFGKSGAYLCTPEANYGRPPRQCFVI